MHAEGSGATLQDRGHVTGTRGLHKGATLRARSYIQPELYFLAVSGQFHDLGSKEGKIDYVRAEHPPEYRLVAPISWATLSVHVVASKASHAALEVYIVSEGTKLIASVTVCLSVSDIQRRGERRGANDACCHADERPGERTTLLLVRVR